MNNILILGGTGKTGRRIARRLKAAGQPVRTASRTSGDIRFDLGSPTTWAPALDGLTAAYVVEPNLQASPDRIPRFVAEAVAAGVRRLVLLSAGGVGEAGDSHPLKADDRHSGQIYQLTGPRAISFGEAADLIGKATGRTIRHVDVAPEVHIERQVANGVPSDVARLLTGILVAIRDGLAAETADGVERALGRPARPFEDYAAETATIVAARSRGKAD